MIRDAALKARRDAAAKRVARAQSTSDFAEQLQQLARGEICHPLNPPPSPQHEMAAPSARTATSLGKRVQLSSSSGKSEIEGIADIAGLTPLRLLQALDSRRSSPSKLLAQQQQQQLSVSHGASPRTPSPLTTACNSAKDLFIIGGRQSSILKPEDIERLREAMMGVAPMKDTSNLLVPREDVMQAAPQITSLTPPAKKTAVPWSKPAVGKSIPRMRPHGSPERKYFFQLEEEIQELQKKVRSETKARALLEAQLREAKQQIKSLIETKRNLSSECEALQKQVSQQAKAAFFQRKQKDNDEANENGGGGTNLMELEDGLGVSLGFRSFRRKTDAVSALGGTELGDDFDVDDTGMDSSPSGFGGGDYYFSRFSRRDFSRKDSVTSQTIATAHDESIPRHFPSTRRESQGTDTDDLATPFFARSTRRVVLEASTEIKAEQALARQSVFRWRYALKKKKKAQSSQL